MMITLQNQTGMKIQCDTGYSWTTLLFGCFVPIFRGDGKWFFIMLICALITYGISNLIFPFFYNDVYIKRLLEKGFFCTDKVGKEWLKQNNMTI